jgi:hypothetical protein
MENLSNLISPEILNSLYRVNEKVSADLANIPFGDHNDVNTKRKAELLLRGLNPFFIMLRSLTTVMFTEAEDLISTTIMLHESQAARHRIVK